MLREFDEVSDELDYSGMDTTALPPYTAYSLISDYPELLIAIITLITIGVSFYVWRMLHSREQGYLVSAGHSLAIND